MRDLIQASCLILMFSIISTQDLCFFLKIFDSFFNPWRINSSPCKRSFLLIILILSFISLIFYLLIQLYGFGFVISILKKSDFSDFYSLFSGLFSFLGFSSLGDSLTFHFNFSTGILINPSLVLIFTSWVIIL